MERTPGDGAAELLIDCALYFDQIGCADRCLEVAVMSLTHAKRSQDQNLIRRALSTTGIAYSRVCDYENSCICLEQAVQIAREMRSDVFEFAALCNVVSVLLVMGLLFEAKALALKLKEFPQGTSDLNHLHLQNCINGLFLARTTDDFGAAREFDELAQKQLTSLKTVSVQWRAYVYAEHIHWLIMIGQAALAETILDEFDVTFKYENSFRAEVIMHCARASCALATDNATNVKICLEALAKLLLRSDNYAFHREDILRSLVELCSHDSISSANEQLSCNYRKLLNEHIVKVKHRQFFDQIARGRKFTNTCELQITRPTYALPKSFSAVEAEGGCVSPRITSVFDGLHHQFDYRVDSPDPVRRLEIEGRLRTPEYSCAEDWAVAADFRVDRSGQHCFQVGALSGLLALRLGLSIEHSVIIEMACRLHDIGKLFVDNRIQNAVNLGKIDEYAVLHRHTIAGSSLLNQINDPVFDLAGQIALMHHEWWNGTGYPGAVRGEGIVLEARICAVADAFIKLSNSSSLHQGWGPVQATRQISTLAGGQLDPNIVAILLELANDDIESLSFSAGVYLPSVNSRLEVAKCKLIRVLN